MVTVNGKIVKSLSKSMRSAGWLFLNGSANPFLFPFDINRINLASIKNLKASVIPGFLLDDTRFFNVVLKINPSWI